MTNNDDNDLDIESFDDEGGFDDFNKKGSLGDLWRNNSMVKIGVILAAFAVIVGGIILFGGEETKTSDSFVSGGSTVREAPAVNETSESYRQALEERNQQMAEDALRTSGSAMPIPVAPPKGTIPVPVEQVTGEDPLDRWKRMQEERVRQQETLAQARPQQAQAQQQQVDTRTPAVNAMAQAMATQMQSILQTQKVAEPKHKKITNIGFVEASERKKLDKINQEQAQLAQRQAQTYGEPAENIILPAGTIEYGQLLIEANTDAPGPVLAQIVSGPLRGSRVLGSFTSSYDYLTLNFSQLVLDGVSYRIEAVAIDPDTTLPGMVTEIDRKYFTRIVLPMAAEFVSGLADAISESGTTTVYISDSSVTQSTADKDSKQEVASGISRAGQTMSSILMEEAKQSKPMLRLATGTPMGVLFVMPVSDRHLVTR